MKKRYKQDEKTQIKIAAHTTSASENPEVFKNWTQKLPSR
jgi:hypothetical protein